MWRVILGMYLNRWWVIRPILTLKQNARWPLKWAMYKRWVTFWLKRMKSVWHNGWVAGFSNGKEMDIPIGRRFIMGKLFGAIGTRKYSFPSYADLKQTLREMRKSGASGNQHQWGCVSCFGRSCQLCVHESTSWCLGTGADAKLWKSNARFLQRKNGQWQDRWSAENMRVWSIMCHYPKLHWLAVRHKSKIASQVFRTSFAGLSCAITWYLDTQEDFLCEIYVTLGLLPFDFDFHGSSRRHWFG